jgi:hypothetical protein
MKRARRLQQFQPPALLARHGVAMSKRVGTSDLARAVVRRARRRRRFEHALVSLWCASVWFLLFAVAWYVARVTPRPDPWWRA